MPNISTSKLTNAQSCRRPRRAAIRALSLALLAPALPLSAQARMALATAINRTAFLRALSQRAAKAYCQMYLKVGAGSAITVLAQTLQQIHSAVQEVDGQSWSRATAKLLDDVRSAALKLESLAAQPVSKEAVLAVSAQADLVLDKANLAVESLERLSPTPTAKLVNVSGRQRMLSQRLAKNFCLLSTHAGGADVQALREQMSGDASAFQGAMEQLSKAPVSTAPIRLALEQGSAQWVFFEAALKRPADARGLNDVATTSERLLTLMDELTQRYETALLDVLG